MPVYKLVKMFDAGGDMNKEWFVSYHFLIPEKLRKPNGKVHERFRVFNTINSIHTKKERRLQWKVVRNSITELLRVGFNPFEQFNCGCVDCRQNKLMALIHSLDK